MSKAKFFTICVLIVLLMGVLFYSSMSDKNTDQNATSTAISGANDRGMDSINSGNTNTGTNTNTSASPKTIVLKAKPVSFTWDTKIVTDKPETGTVESQVNLIATFADKSTQKVEVGVFGGSCNLQDIDVKLALNSKQLTCYFAGAGDNFRVVEANGKFMVQRQEFEEGSPDYNPPIQKFETVINL